MRGSEFQQRIPVMRALRRKATKRITYEERPAGSDARMRLEKGIIPRIPENAAKKIGETALSWVEGHKSIAPTVKKMLDGESYLKGQAFRNDGLRGVIVEDGVLGLKPQTSISWYIPKLRRLLRSSAPSVISNAHVVSVTIAGDKFPDGREITEEKLKSAAYAGFVALGLPWQDRDLNTSVSEITKVDEGKLYAMVKEGKITARGVNAAGRATEVWAFDYRPVADTASSIPAVQTPPPVIAPTEHV